jgi:hypothetical protein
MVLFFMSKEKLLELYLSKNPKIESSLANGEITLTTAGFKKFFHTTYDVAYNQGFSMLPASDEDIPPTSIDECLAGDSASLNLLKSIFRI